MSDCDVKAMEELMGQPEPEKQLCNECGKYAVTWADNPKDCEQVSTCGHCGDEYSVSYEEIYGSMYVPWGGV